MATVTETLGSVYDWGGGPPNETLYLWIPDSGQPGSLFMFVYMTQADWDNEVLVPTEGWVLVHEPIAVTPPHPSYVVGVYRNDNPPVGSDDWELVDTHGSGRMHCIRVSLEEGEELLAFTAAGAGYIDYQDVVAIPGAAPATGTVVMAAEALPTVPL